MPVEITTEPAPKFATVLELFESPDARRFIDDVYMELRRRERTPLFLYDVDLLDLEHQYALARTLTGCPTDRRVLLHTSWLDSLCTVLQRMAITGSTKETS